MLEDVIDTSKSAPRKIDIHTQTNAFTPQAAAAPEQIVKMAEASGYDAIFLTEHGRVWPERQLIALRELSINLRVYPGIELTLNDGHTLLVLGASDPVYETFTEAGDALAQAAKDGYLTVLAAPADPVTGLPEWLPLVDAIEVQTCYQASTQWHDSAQKRAEATALAAVHSGGVQGLNFLNKFWIEVDTEFESPREFRNLIVSRSFRNEARSFTMQIPPAFKTPRMEDLTEQDLSALPNGPEPSLSTE